MEGRSAAAPLAARAAAAATPALFRLPAAEAAEARERRLNAARISVSIADCRVAGSSSRCLPQHNTRGICFGRWKGKRVGGGGWGCCSIATYL